MGWTTGVLGFDFRRGLGLFLFTTATSTALGPTQPPIQWAPGALSLEVQRPGREADDPPPSSAEVKECVELYLHPQYVFMAWCFTFYLLFTPVYDGARLAQWYSAEIQDGRSGHRIPAEAGNFSLHHRVQTRSAAHPASYPMGSRGSFTEGKPAGS
jgi:hypothetical protein